MRQGYRDPTRTTREELDMTELDGLGYRDATVVVVGCASGIGEATARILGDLGARVHAVSLHRPSVPHETFHGTDLGRLDSVAPTVDALHAIGPINHLFCASGIPVTRDSLQILRVNYVGVRHLVEQLVPEMHDGSAVGIVASNVARGWEQRLPMVLEILDLTDPDEAMEWFDAHPDEVADGYRLSKQLLVAWVARVAPALATTRRIRINCTAPGVTDTALVEETKQYVPDGFFDNYPYPLFDRAATSVEQAWSLVLLNSALNPSVTGSTLYCDQGVTNGMTTGALPATH
jgi:NAD(P)-dependent dehydrogenase (short-subunit alcohol dehydrogenase family)